MSNTRMRVAVRVHPTIREFIIDTNGSDLIVPGKHDLLWKKVKANLVTYSEQNAIKENPEDSYIYIELLDMHSTKQFTKDKGYINMNPMYRCFLSKKGQSLVAAELRKRFKDSFHTFVMGALVGNPNLQQKEAFELFIEKFNLTQNKVTFDMLKKSWDRSEHKKFVFNKKNFCTLLF